MLVLSQSFASFMLPVPGHTGTLVPRLVLCYTRIGLVKICLFRLWAYFGWGLTQPSVATSANT